MMGDFKTVRTQLPQSWQASSNGKIYWCIEIPGHLLAVVDGKLLVDDQPAQVVFEKLLED